MVSTIFLSILGFVIGAYVIYLLLLFFFQEQLIFQKVKPNLLSYKKLSPLEIHLITNDGITLHGWSTSNHNASELHDSTLIYFGGNAQDVSTMLPILEELQVKHAYTFNYRGYGLSEGIPSEKNLYADSIEIVNQIKSQHKDTKIILMGHSLGSAVAGFVASQTPPSKLILLCPLHSISKIATSRYQAPSSFIKHNFSLVKTAKLIKSPSLILLAENDSVIPESHSLATIKHLTNNKAVIKIPNCGHNDLFQETETLLTINRFLTDTKKR